MDGRTCAGPVVVHYCEFYSVGSVSDVSMGGIGQIRFFPVAKIPEEILDGAVGVVIGGVENNGARKSGDCSRIGRDRGRRRRIGGGFDKQLDVVK